MIDLKDVESHTCERKVYHTGQWHQGVPGTSEQDAGRVVSKQYAGLERDQVSHRSEKKQNILTV